MRKKIGECLIQAGLITEDDLRNALVEHKRTAGMHVMMAVMVVAVGHVELLEVQWLDFIFEHDRRN